MFVFIPYGTAVDKGILSLHTFLEHMDRNAAEPATAPATADLLAFGPELPSLDQATHLLLREALRRAKGNQTAAARLLGISRRTMNRYFASGTIAPAPDETTP